MKVVHYHVGNLFGSKLSHLTDLTDVIHVLQRLGSLQTKFLHGSIKRNPTGTFRGSFLGDLSLKRNRKVCCKYT